jgi:DNA-nicking Smr family endonuclease
MSNEDEDSLFLKEMEGVRPLKKDVRDPEKVKNDSLMPGLNYRRESAQRALDLDETQLPTTFVEPVRPEAVISFKRDGIQHGVFRSLQRGDYAHEAMLDLHGLTVEQARQELYRFVADCVHYDVRSALISHGKGRNNKDNIPLLKSFLVRWLPMFPQVMAFHSAQRWHGGAGAVYVLFRKTERAKDVTRERLGLGAGKPNG